MKIVKYAVLEAYNGREMEIRVNCALEKGWCLYGHLASTGESNMLYQAVVKYEQPVTPPPAGQSEEI